jgi:hypothetical protein
MRIQEVSTMLKMAGVQLHPAVRILIGGVLIALAIARHTTLGLFVGIVLVVWGFAAVLGLMAGGRDAESQQRRSK